MNSLRSFPENPVNGIPSSETCTLFMSIWRYERARIGGHCLYGWQRDWSSSRLVACSFIYCIMYTCLQYEKDVRSHEITKIIETDCVRCDELNKQSPDLLQLTALPQ